MAVVTLFALGFSTNAQQVSATSKARFVAYDKFSGWGNPREPVQLLLIEVQGKDRSKLGGLIKVIYRPKTNGFRGDAEFLEMRVLGYENTWNMVLSRPKEKELRLCDIGNYLLTSDNRVDTDENGEPTTRFHSTLIDADLVVGTINELPCMILDSFSK